MFFTFKFETFHLEAAYDNVTVQNLSELGAIKMLPGRTYISPFYDILFKFDSDGSITQAGFKVKIYQYRNVSLFQL